MHLKYRYFLFRIQWRNVNIYGVTSKHFFPFFPSHFVTDKMNILQTSKNINVQTSKPFCDCISPQTTKIQKAVIQKKEHTIRKTQGDIRDMVSAIGILKKQSSARKGKLLSISDVLSKVPGDAVSKLKYGKESQKMCVYTHRINHLFYYDHQEEDTLTPKSELKTKLDAKYIVVKDISVNHPAIGQQMNGKNWFLLIGDSRSALFVAESKEVRDKWVLFVKRSLGHRMTTEKELSVLQGGGPNRHGRAYSAMAPSPRSPRNQMVSPRKSGQSLSGAPMGQSPFGQCQSPIDIRTTTKSGTTRIVKQSEYAASTLEFRYPEKVKNCTIMNNGHTVWSNWKCGCF